MMLLQSWEKFHPDLKENDFPYLTNKEIKPEITGIVNVLKGFENLSEER
jgi:hypothetical protein